jgi:hypothetical protein
MLSLSRGGFIKKPQGASTLWGFAFGGWFSCADLLTGTNMAHRSYGAEHRNCGDFLLK